jgi:hypothetical protein
MAACTLSIGDVRSGEAVEDFDLMTQGRHDQPLFLNRATPLPCTDADFFFSDRFMTISGNDSEPIDSLTGEAMSARVSERIEDVTIGQVTGATYGTQSAGSHAHQGTATVYGMANFTYRTNKTNLTTPTGANPQSTITDVLAMIQTLKNNAFGRSSWHTSLAWTSSGQHYAFINSNWASARPKRCGSWRRSRHQRRQSYLVSADERRPARAPTP